MKFGYPPRRPLIFVLYYSQAGVLWYYLGARRGVPPLGLGGIDDQKQSHLRARCGGNRFRRSRDCGCENAESYKIGVEKHAINPVASNGTGSG